MSDGQKIPRMTMNINHYPDHKCGLCSCIRFNTAVMVKYNPLRFTEKFIIPVYACQNCGEILDLTVTPKKHTEQ